MSDQYDEAAEEIAGKCYGERLSKMERTIAAALREAAAIGAADVMEGVAAGFRCGVISRDPAEWDRRAASLRAQGKGKEG